MTIQTELISNQLMNGPLYPFGPTFPVLFDKTIDVTGWKEITVIVHVFVENYATAPVTSATKLQLRFMHNFSGDSFDYEKATIPWNNVTSDIKYYVTKPLIGNSLRLLCTPENLPAGIIFRLTVTIMNCDHHELPNENKDAEYLTISYVSSN